MSHEELRHLLGGYVLGGLSPADRAELESHLTGCAECRAELAGFAPLPGLLGRTAPAATGAPVVPPPDLLPRLLTGVRRERSARRRRTALAGLAAAVLLVLGGWALADRTPPAPDTPDTQAPAAVIDLTGGAASGTAALADKPWGTALTLDATDLPATGPFTLQVVGADGRTQLAATWGRTPNGRAVVAGATSLHRDDIASVRVLGPAGTVLSGPA